MSGWLLDTNVASAFAPGRLPVAPRTEAWFERHNDGLYLSSVTIAEIEVGVAKLRREGAAARARAMSAWLDRLIALYGGRVLAFDVDVARVAGRLSDAARAQGRHPGFADIAIAATAKAHELSLLTMNMRHFEMFDIDASDPFAAA